MSMTPAARENYAGIGRPWKLADPEIQQRLLDAIRTGGSINVACDYADVQRSSYFDLMARVTDPDPEDPPEQWMIDLADQVRKARSECELLHVQNINRAGSRPQTWQASAWFLERSYPDRWGRARQALDVTVTATEDPRVTLANALAEMDLIDVIDVTDLEVADEHVPEGTSGADAGGRTPRPAGPALPAARRRSS